jgi:hypothetical protein
MKRETLLRMKSDLQEGLDKSDQMFDDKGPEAKSHAYIIGWLQGTIKRAIEAIEVDEIIDKHIKK